MSLRMILALSLFVVSFILISTEKINKTLVAIIAAMLFISMGLIDQQEAFYHVDWNVIFLLIGMMIIVGITKKHRAVSVHRHLDRESGKGRSG
jgi:Na+/H+ antiporter NhaD/arsenite permease-like protein